MFEGRSKYNKSVFGWAGHMENGSTFGSLEVQEVLNTNWSHYVHSINPLSDQPISWLKPQQPVQCTYFDQKDLTQNGAWMNDFFFEFEKRQNVGITIFVSDRVKKVSRTLKSNYEAYSGSRIMVEDLNKPSLKKFFLTFQQTEFSTEVTFRKSIKLF